MERKRRYGGDREIKRAQREMREGGEMVQR